MKQTLRNLIAEGKTKQALTKLHKLTAADSDVSNQVQLLAALT